MAKAAAAKIALYNLANITYGISNSSVNSPCNFPTELQQYALSQSVADRIGK